MLLSELLERVATKPICLKALISFLCTLELTK